MAAQPSSGTRPNSLSHSMPRGGRLVIHYSPDDVERARIASAQKLASTAFLVKWSASISFRAVCDRAAASSERASQTFAASSSASSLALDDGDDVERRARMSERNINKPYRLAQHSAA